MEISVTTENGPVRHHKGFDEQIISSRTGHRSTAIRNYKVPSGEQQFALSKILDPPTANMISTVTLHDTDGNSEERRAKIPSTHGPAANVSSNLISQETSEECPVSLQLSGTFQNCTFNLSFFGKKLKLFDILTVKVYDFYFTDVEEFIYLMQSSIFTLLNVALHCL